MAQQLHLGVGMADRHHLREVNQSDVFILVHLWIKEWLGEAC